MKNSIIEDLFVEAYDAHESKSTKQTSLHLKLSEAYNDFYGILSKEQQEMFKKLEDLQSDDMTVTEANYFKRGVKFAVRLLTECLFD